MQARFQAGLTGALQQFQKVSPVPKLLCALFPFFYFLSFLPGAEENLVVTPGFLAPPLAKLWTIATAIFYENNLIWVFFDIIALVGFSVLLEPLWGLKRFLMFMCLIGVVSMTSVAMICFMLYAVSGSVNILFAQLHGFIGLVCGCLVALKQVHPDSVAFPPPSPPTLRVKHLPLMVTFCALLFAVIKFVSFTHSLLAFNGMVVSWIYLRFYEKQDNGSRGDMSEGFSFATFFPEIMHPLLSSLGELVYRVLVKLKICRNAVRTYDVSAPSTIKISLPGGNTVDTERRKQKALKALDERLNRTTQQISWPSLVDDNSTGNSSDEQSTSLTTLTSNTAASNSAALPPEVVVVSTAGNTSTTTATANVSTNSFKATPD